MYWHVVYPADPQDAAILKRFHACESSWRNNRKSLLELIVWGSSGYKLQTDSDLPAKPLKHMGARGAGGGAKAPLKRCPLWLGGFGFGLGEYMVFKCDPVAQISHLPAHNFGVKGGG